MSCRFLTQAGVGACRQGAVGGSVHAIILLTNCHGQQGRPAPQTCLHFLCFNTPCLLLRLLICFRRWRGWNGHLPCQCLPPLSRAGQGTHCVPVSLSQLENQAGALRYDDRFSEHQPLTSPVNPNLLGDISI